MNKHCAVLFFFCFITTISANNTYYLNLAQYKNQDQISHTYSYAHNHRSYNDCSYQQTKPDLSSYSCSQLKTYFAQYRYSEAEILSQSALYKSDEFVKLAKTYIGYEAAVTNLYHKMKRIGTGSKVWGWMNGEYCSGLAQRIEDLYQELQSAKKQSVSQQQVNNQRASHYQPFHCQQQFINVLQLFHDTRAVADQLEIITQDVFKRAEDHYYDIDVTVENSINASLDILRDSSHAHEFIFHTALVDHLLCDIEEQILEHKSTFLERSPKLVAQALTTFVKGLNPVAQLKNTCEFIVHSAHFVADVTVGKLYLSEDKYQERIDNFWSTCQALSPSNLARLEAEQWVDLVAQCAADAVFFGGVGKAVRYLKEIGAVQKTKQQAYHIAQKLKTALDVSLAEQPLVATAEGLMFRATDEIKQLGGVAKEVIKDSQLALELFHAQFMAKLAPEIVELRKLFDCTRKGFAEFANKWIKIDYDHVLGMELKFNKKGLSRLGGFHHDLASALEKSDVLKLVNKTFHEKGFYKADVVMNGKAFPGKTFFPSHWSRKQVIEKIYEAYDNFINRGGLATLGKDEKYFIKSMTSDGVKIEMYISRKGKIVTAYPVLT